jgi:hypothetical protein
MRTLSIETAIENIRQDILAASPRHDCDPDLIAAVYSVLRANRGEPVCVVTGDKTASQVYVEGKPMPATTKADHEFSADEAEQRVIKTVRDTFDESDLARFLSECHPGETVRVGETICRCDPETLAVTYLDK